MRNSGCLTSQCNLPKLIENGSRERIHVMPQSREECRQHRMVAVVAVLKPGNVRAVEFAQRQLEDLKWSHLFGQFCSFAKVYRV